MSQMTMNICFCTQIIKIMSKKAMLYFRLPKTISTIANLTKNTSTRMITSSEDVITGIKVTKRYHIYAMRSTEMKIILKKPSICRPFWNMIGNWITTTGSSSAQIRRDLWCTFTSREASKGQTELSCTTMRTTLHGRLQQGISRSKSLKFRKSRMLSSDGLNIPKSCVHQIAHSMLTVGTDMSWVMNIISKLQWMTLMIQAVITHTESSWQITPSASWL